MDQNIPFINKKVRDYLESGESNAMVIGTKSTIDKLSTTIE